jgi:hypothetical protein
MYETMKEAGYKHLKSIGNGQHILLDLDTGIKEMFFCNKNHASWGIIYKNTHLEFAHSIKEGEECST